MPPKPTLESRSMRVELRAEARADIVAGALFFDRQRDGLGDHFTDCVFSDLRSLQVQAGIHQLVFGLHRKLVSRFPFAIYYRSCETTIDVVAILDCRRDPESHAYSLDLRTSGSGQG